MSSETRITIPDSTLARSADHRGAVRRADDRRGARLGAIVASSEWSSHSHPLALSLTPTQEVEGGGATSETSEDFEKAEMPHANPDPDPNP